MLQVLAITLWDIVPYSQVEIHLFFKELTTLIQGKSGLRAPKKRGQFHTHAK
jgi:hypothetical protein